MQDDVYDMTTYPRGRAVIINNEFFTKVSPPRLGTQVDEQRLEQLFKSLYFEVDVHKDLTADVRISSYNSAIIYIRISTAANSIFICAF